MLFLVDDPISDLLDSETVLESLASPWQGPWLGFPPLACHSGLSQVELLSWLAPSGPSLSWDDTHVPGMDQAPQHLTSQGIRHRTWDPDGPKASAFWLILSLGLSHLHGPPLHQHKLRAKEDLRRQSDGPWPSADLGESLECRIPLHSSHQHKGLQKDSQ